MNILQRNAAVLEINVVEFFEADKDDMEVNSVNELLLQKVRLLEKPDETQKNSICNMIDTTIAKKRLKDALNNAINIVV